MPSLTMEHSGTENRVAEQRSNSSQSYALNAWNVLKVNWLKLLFFVIVGWVLAAVYFVLADSDYESNAELYVIRKDATLATEGVTGRTTESSVSEDFLATQMQIIQSRRILGKVLERPQPRNVAVDYVINRIFHYYHLTPPEITVRIKDLPGLASEIDPDENPVDYLVDNLRVSRGGGGQAKEAHVLKISFTHSSDVETKVILDALLAEYADYLKSKFQDVNKDAAVLIEQAMDELETAMDDAEKSYTQFRKEAPLLWTEDGSSNVHLLRFEVIQNELSQLNLKISEATTRLQVVRETLRKQIESGAPAFDRLALIDEQSAARIAMMLTVQQGEAETADFQSKQPERMEAARTEYQSIMAMKLEMETLIEQFGFGPNHPKIASLRQQIETAEGFVQDRSNVLDVPLEDMELGPQEVLDAYLTLLENDLSALHARKSQLELEAQAEENAARQLVEYELEGESKQQEIVRLQELHDAIVARLQNINLAKEYGGVINDVITPPELGKVVWPKLPTCLALGTLLGLCMGGGLTLVSELQNRSFRSADEVTDLLETQLLTHLPNVNPRSDSMLRRHLRKSKSRVSPFNYVHHLPQSTNAEVYRGLRTALFFRRSQQQNIFAITSPDQSDGKSTMTSCLATSIAQTGKSVLLVDCDMRSPSVNEMLGLNNNAGLTEVLAENQSPWELVQETDADNLFALTTGRTPDNPAELLESKRFKDVLQLFQTKYDFVLLDCPPLLAVSDPAIIAPDADGVILLVNVSSNSRPEAIEAKEVLDNVGANTLGVVVLGGDESKHYAYEGRVGRYGNYGQNGLPYGQQNGHSNGHRNSGSTRPENSRQINRAS